MYEFSIIWQLSLEGTFVLFSIRRQKTNSFFLFPLRPASTFLSTSSSPVGSFRSLQEARMRKSSESAFTSCSCPSASSSRRRTKAPRPSHRHRCVWACVKNQWQAWAYLKIFAALSYMRLIVWIWMWKCAPLDVFFLRGSCWCSCERWEIGCNWISCCQRVWRQNRDFCGRFSLISGRSAQQGSCLHWFQRRPKQNKLKTPKIILITHQKQMLVQWCICALFCFLLFCGEKNCFFFPVVHMLVLWCPSDLMSSLSGIIQLNFSYFPIFFSVHLTHTKSKHVFSFRSHNELHIFAKTSLLIFKNQIAVATWTIPAALCPCSVWKPLF